MDITVRYYIDNYLPEPVRLRYLSNVKMFPKDITFRHTIDIVHGDDTNITVFIPATILTSRTPEGDSYWDDISRTYTTKGGGIIE